MDQPEIVLRNSLDLYCEWLNLWQADDDINDHRYSPEQFLSTDPTNNLYGSWRLNGTCPEGSSVPQLFHFVITDGDEGGPTDLYVWADDDNHIVSIVQGFDTSLQMIFRAEYPVGLIDMTKPSTREDKQFFHTPEDR